MAIRFKEELIQLEFVIGEDTAREGIKDILTVEEESPDVYEILEVKACPRSVKGSIVEQGVHLDGTVDVWALYVAEGVDPHQSIHEARGHLEYTGLLEIPGAAPGMQVMAQVEVVKTGFRRLSPRQIEVSVTLKKCIKVTELRQVHMITDIKGLPPESVQEELLRVEHVVGDNVLNTDLEGRMIVPQDQPPCARIILTEVRILATESSIVDEAVTLRGRLEGTVLYAGNGEEEGQSLHCLTNTFSFEETINLPQARAGMRVLPVVHVVKVDTRRLDSRTLEMGIQLELFVKVTQPRQILAVVDVDTEDVDSKKELLRVEHMVGEKTSQDTITRLLEIPKGHPPMERMLNMEIRSREIIPQAQENGVLLRGDMEASLLYVPAPPSPEETRPIHFLSMPLALEAFLSIPGTEPSFQVHSKTLIQSVDYRVQGPGQIAMEVVVENYGRVVELRQLEVIVDMVAIAPVVRDPCPPTFVIYVVQPGDTLFKIARRFQTTVEKLLETNPGKVLDSIHAGEKICVPKSIIKSRE